MPEVYSEERAWGHFERFSLNEPTTVKLLFIKEGNSLHLQTHEKRNEFWQIIKGEPEIIINSIKKTAKIGDRFFAPNGANHKISATTGDVVVLEISRGMFDEKDIVHLEE